MLNARRHAELEEAGERLDRGEASVARTCTVSSRRFEIIEKGQHERHVELLYGERGGSRAKPLGRKDQQELEGVRVGVAGVRARVTLSRETLAQERRQVWREWRRRAPRRASASLRAATSTSTRGVACKYQ